MAFFTHTGLRGKEKTQIRNGGDEEAGSFKKTVRYCISPFLQIEPGIATGSHKKDHSKQLVRLASRLLSWQAIISVLRGWENSFQKTRTFFGMSGSRNIRKQIMLYAQLIPPPSWKQQQEKIRGSLWLVHSFLIRNGNIRGFLKNYQVDTPRKNKER